MSIPRNPSALTVDDATKHVGTRYDASADEVTLITGRRPLDVSNWKWLVLGNGDLCLAYFPQGYQYEVLSSSLNLDG
jgi:hypothetical protein